MWMEMEGQCGGDGGTHQLSKKFIKKNRTEVATKIVDLKAGKYYVGLLPMPSQAKPMPMPRL